MKSMIWQPDTSICYLKCTTCGDKINILASVDNVLSTVKTPEFNEARKKHKKLVLYCSKVMAHHDGWNNHGEL